MYITTFSIGYKSNTGWKETIAAEHVTLVLPTESESSRYLEVQGDFQGALFQSDFDRRIVFSNADNGLVNAAALESSTTGAPKAPKFRIKPEKGTKIKYIPKHRITT